MDELMVAPNLPPGIAVNGAFDSAPTAKPTDTPTSGWTAMVLPSGQPSPNGLERLERVRLECWLMAGSKRRTLVLESYRTPVERVVNVLEGVVFGWCGLFAIAAVLAGTGVIGHHDWYVGVFGFGLVAIIGAAWLATKLPDRWG